jgi:hypothetical protein
MADFEARRRVINRGAAIGVPLVILGAAAYVTFVAVDIICGTYSEARGLGGRLIDEQFATFWTRT